MADQLPAPGSEGTPTTDCTPTDLPRNLTAALARLAPGWRHRIVWGRATTLVKERPAVDRRMTARLADVAGMKASERKRKTIDVPRLLESVSLRVQHSDGTRAYAVWARIDKAKGWTSWEFTGAGVLEPGAPPVYELSWSDFYAAIQWTPEQTDELEVAA